MNLKTISDAIGVFRYGASVANAAKAKNLSAFVGSLSLLVYILAEMSKRAGYDLDIDYDAAQDIATGIGALAGMFVTFATSEKVGLPGLAPATPGIEVRAEPGAPVQTEMDLRGGP